MKQADRDSFVISDTHFSHANILTFMDSAGCKVRPGFSSVDEMNEFMVDRWNSVVKPNDKVYHLGDVAMKKQFVSIVNRLNGKKRLIMGNHDIFNFRFYADYFEEVYAMRVLPKEGIMMTHIPLHINSVKRWCINVHGHIHQNIIAQDTQMILGHVRDQHPRYFNVCVEQHNYTPVSIDVIRDAVKLSQVHSE